MTLSPASVRNVMSDLEHLGLIYAPHTSAGRLPTETGLRLFVDGLLEVGDLTEEERRADRGADRRQAREGAGAGADRGRRDALGPVALRRRRARRQAGGRAQAHRVRAAGARQGAGRAGGRGPGAWRTASSRCRPGCRRRAWCEATNYLNARIARPHARRGARPGSRRSRRPPRPSSTS